MQQMLTVHILMALTFITSLSTQIGVHDVGSLVRAETEKVQGVETQDKEAAAELRRQEIETKRLEIEQKNAAKRAEVTERLSGKRAEQCEAKQDQINRMLDDRSEAATRHLETFQAIQERLEAYVMEQQLEIQYDNARQIIIPDAQLNAELAVQNLQNLEYDCASVDAAAPGAIVKERITAAKEELEEYRNALKDYAEAVGVAATNEAALTDDASNEQGGANE